MLEWCNDGLFAHPCPTWSRCRHSLEGEFFPFEKAVPVKSILMLERGAKREEIREVAGYLYWLVVSSASNIFVQLHSKYLNGRLQETVLANIRMNIQRICDHFPPLGLFATLDANLHDTLSDCKLL